MGIRSWIQKHPLLAYFLITYLISWGASLVILGPVFSGGATSGPAGAVIALFGMMSGPMLSGLICTRVVDGKPGMQELGARLRTWRVGRWWLTLVIFPAIYLLVLMGMGTIISPKFLPGFLFLGVIYGLLAGLFEEIGWTGFATSRMQALHGPLLGAGLLGLLHGVWHACADFLSLSRSMGPVWFLYFTPMFIVALPAMRILMAWVYNRTGSLPLGQFLHATFTGGVVALSPAGLAPTEIALWYWVFAAVIWIVTIIVITRVGRRLGQPAL